MRRSGSTDRTGRQRRTSTGDLSRIGARSPDRAERRSGAPYLVPTSLALVAAVAVWASWGRLASCGTSLDAPETQLRKALAQQTRAHLADVYGFRGGGTVELFDVRFADVTPTVDRTDASVHVQAGDTISVWLKFNSLANGRAYFGFGASVAGTYSLVAAPNTNQLVGQRPGPAKPRRRLKILIHGRVGQLDQAGRALEVPGGERMLNGVGRQAALGLGMCRARKMGRQR